jgi:hypothetical protein
VVEDDLGTAYAPGGLSGSDDRWRARYQAEFTPATPSAATMLRLTVAGDRFTIHL